MCMRRYLLMIFILLLMVACRSLIFPLPPPAPSLTSTSPSPTLTSIPPSLTPTFLLTQTPSPLAATPSWVATATPVPISESFMVLYHPDDILYVGDQVSLEIVSPPGLSLKDANLQVQVDPPDGLNLGPVNFGPWGIQGREEATLLWVWDTRHLEPGRHTLAFSIQPQGFSWTEQVTLLPQTEMPPYQSEPP